jgi:hypothetical protein
MKWKQVAYRVFYTIRNRYRKRVGFCYPFTLSATAQRLTLQPSIDAPQSYLRNRDEHTFTFLNLSHTFKDKIDWNFDKHGKLWTYNLNYFDFLHQPNFDKEGGILLIEMFIADIDKNRDGLEPFPIALRGINWVKFLSKYHIHEPDIDDSLLAQYYILMDNLEYHLLGNHLLENGFSLLFGAYYFGDEKLFDKAKEILITELEEQILPDGAHFELAPMYHQIMLYRVLDCYNLIQNNTIFIDSSLKELLEEKARLMLGWLKNMTYDNGQVPMLNDTAEGIAPASSELFAYGAMLGLKAKILPLKESGYRKMRGERYELIVDVGDIGPDYIPGHAHSDTFNFELYVDKEPLIVDTGISTYESNRQRAYERSTAAHNTVMIDNQDQSEVWSSFRVARRAKIIDLKEDINYVKATHNGYARLGVLHTREVKGFGDQLEIKDIVYSDLDTFSQAVAYLHFAPGVEPVSEKENTLTAKYTLFSFKGLKRLEIVDIVIAKGYNKLLPAKGVKLFFEKELVIRIKVVSK